ncbi:MAG: asparagine synthetase B family protein, partial [Planctomycetota bacterium]
GAGVPVVNVEPSNPFVGGGSDPPSREAADADEIERLIEQAVARRLEADVPLGCFLSGGVDSSLIAFFAKKHKPDLRTFSVQMPEPRYDESHFAQQVADRLDIDHTTLSVAANPAQDLVKLIRILGQPFGDSSILPTYWVSKAAREQVTVALGGDGGDELFAGYERYLAAPKLARYARWLSRIPVRLGRRAHPKSRLTKLGRLGEMARDFPALGVLATESIFTQPQIDRLLGAAPRPQASLAADVAAGEEDGAHDNWGAPARWDAGDNAMAALRLADLAGYLPNDLLCKVDTASMAVALEVRCPYLDRDLATALLATPIDRLVPRGQRKGLLRRIARRHLPAEIVDRPKMGFAIPIGQWFRTDFGGMRTLLLDHLRSAEPFGPIHLERREVRRLIQEHMSGACDHGQRLFALLTLSIWAGVRS